eukprot:99272-Rhodomonas_salina.2
MDVFSETNQRLGNGWRANVFSESPNNESAVLLLRVLAFSVSSIFEDGVTSNPAFRLSTLGSHPLNRR